MAQFGVDIDVGSDCVDLPPFVHEITGFYLTGLRGRPYRLTRLSPEELDDRRKNGPHIPSLPMFYAVTDSNIMFWPTSAYFWNAVIEDHLELDPNAGIPAAVDRIAGDDVKTTRYRRPD